MNANFRKILLYVRAIIPLIFLSVGLYCIIFPEYVKMDLDMSRMFGGMAIVYGLFRGYRAIKAIKEEGN